jgi:hypothetical protein
LKDFEVFSSVFHFIFSLCKDFSVVTGKTTGLPLFLSSLWNFSRGNPGVGLCSLFVFSVELFELQSHFKRLAKEGWLEPFKKKLLRAQLE